MIGAGVTAPVKPALPRAVRCPVRGQHIQPRISELATPPFHRFPRPFAYCPARNGVHASKVCFVSAPQRSRTSLLRESWNRQPSGAAKIPQESRRCIAVGSSSRACGSAHVASVREVLRPVAAGYPIAHCIVCAHAPPGGYHSSLHTRSFQLPPGSSPGPHPVYVARVTPSATYLGRYPGCCTLG